MMVSFCYTTDKTESYNNFLVLGGIGSPFVLVTYVTLDREHLRCLFRTLLALQLHLELSKRPPSYLGAVSLPISVDGACIKLMADQTVSMVHGFALIPMKGLTWVMLVVAGLADARNLGESKREVFQDTRVNRSLFALLSVCWQQGNPPTLHSGLWCGDSGRHSRVAQSR